jgi:hypothetical protein
MIKGDEDMSEQAKPKANPDDLTKTTEPGNINLTEEELGQVAGGSSYPPEPPPPSRDRKIY